MPLLSPVHNKPAIWLHKIPLSPHLMTGTVYYRVLLMPTSTEVKSSIPERRICTSYIRLVLAVTFLLWMLLY